jgi:hypothetical protein
VGILEEETGPPEGISRTCGKKVRAFLDNGGIWLICTLESHHDGRHYDDVFLTPWKDIEKNPDN